MKVSVTLQWGFSMAKYNINIQLFSELIVNWSVSVATTAPGGLYTFQPNCSHSPEWSTWLINTLQSIQLPDLPDMWMCRGKAMHSCLCVCVCVCVSAKKYLKILQAGSLKHLQMSVKQKINQHNQIVISLYLMQVQMVLYAVISATSCYRFRGSTPFEIVHGSYSQQRKSYLPLLSMWPCSLTESISECGFVYH